MSPDTNGDDDGAEAVEPRSLRLGEWVRSPRFVDGAALVVLGVLVAGLEFLDSAGTLTDLTANQVLFVSVVVIVVGVAVALSGYRLTARQRQYLDQAERRRLEIRDYLSLLDDVEIGQPESNWEIRSRLQRARTNLERARQSVYRRDYADFLSLYYEASRQEILLYNLLDSRADGWTFGLETDHGSGPDVQESSRLLNLSRRIRSYARPLPERRRNLVEEFLGASDDDPPTPLDLYYAVRELHDWNVSRYERATQIRRFLRGGILVMVVVLVGLALVLASGFGGTFLSEANPANGSTSVESSSVLLKDAFLGLIVLVGALGAVFSMIYRSSVEFYTLTTDQSIPQPVFMLEALLARTLFGSVSALFVFLVVRTELAGVVFAESLLTSPLAVLAVGFVAGFSERFVTRAVEEVTESVHTPENESPDEETTDASEANGGRSTGEGAPDEAERVTGEGGAGDEGADGGARADDGGSQEADAGDDDTGPDGGSPGSS